MRAWRFWGGALVLAAGLAACGAPPSDGPRPLASTVRQVGRWEGRGDATLGDIVSSSGRLRIHWQTRDAAPDGSAFTLTLHSGVSGRPLATLVEHQGEGGGRVDFADDPRPYMIYVRAAGVAWTVWVEEELGVYGDGPRGP
ncbi:MAG: hypothetical protein AB1635_09720 [Acidobacteriota bacterium]